MLLLLDKYFNNKEKQYENIPDGIFLSGHYVKASYIQQEEPTYKNNLLIEALPSIRNMEQVYDEIEKMPIYSEEERKMDEMYRLHAIYRLEDYIFPISKHFEIEQKIAIVIRRGYVHKKVLSPEYIKALRNTSILLNATESDVMNFKETLITSCKHAPSTSGFDVIGVSGAGKSTSVNKILSLYPQVIRHDGDGEKKFLFYQLPWIKIDCAYNGNIKGLCQKFFNEIDCILGTDYLRKFGNSRFSIDRMIIAMAHITQIHGLGMLVIDEIQHLKCSKKENESALNFFVSMMNEMKLPIVYIGTYKAINNLLAMDYRIGRRSSGIGDVELSYISNDDEWDLFIENLWNYQWVKNKCELSKELKDKMYSKTAGIIDRVIKLFMAVQFEAIRSGQERITATLIEKVADEKFTLTKKMLDALIKHDTAALEKYQDMQNPNVDKIFQYAKEDLKQKEMAKEILQSKMRENKIKKSEIINDICIFLSQAGYDYNKVVKVVENIVVEYGIDKSPTFLKQKTISKLIMEQHLNESNNDEGTKKAITKRKGNHTKLELQESLLENIKDDMINSNEKESTTTLP